MADWVILVDSAARFSECRHPAQGDHHQGLPGAHQPVLAARARRSSTCRARSTIRAAATTARCSPRRAATASSPRSRRWSTSARASSTRRPCPNSTTRSLRRLPPPTTSRAAPHSRLFRHASTIAASIASAACCSTGSAARFSRSPSRTAAARRSSKLASVPVTKLTPAELALFHDALHTHTTREWRSQEGPRHAALFLRRALRSELRSCRPPTSRP